MNRRAVAAVGILGAWLGGLGMLVQREYFRPRMDRLAEAALRVQTAAVFFAVLQGNTQVGFASSTVDTSTSMIEQRDYLVADVPVGGRVHRATARTNVTLTRTLRVRTFDFELDADQSPMRVRGDVSGDTLLTIVIGTGTTADTQRVALAGPILLPTLAPMAIALEERPSVGKEYLLPLFDPVGLAPKDVRIAVRAESLFVVNDSSVFDSTSNQWRGVLPDTVRAWKIESEGGTGVGGWVDQQGRLVASSQMGFRLERRPYEVAFENWRRQTDSAGKRPAPALASSRDVLEVSAIAANKRLRSSLSQLRVRLGGVPLAAGDFTLNGGRQRLAGDTLIVERESAQQLSARYIAGDESTRADTRPEPFLESAHPEIVALAQQIANGSRDPRLIAMRINRWVYDSLQKAITIGIPSALHVLHTRRGDCNEHAQLYVALARAAGVPARVASGLAYVDGKFYYHAWPEVRLRSWVAVDPTFGQFPADAAHLRFVTGGLGRQMELLRLVGNLRIDVIGTR